SAADMEATFNQGVGMVAIVAAADAEAVVRTLTERNVAAWIAGRIEARSGGDSSEAGAARLVGAHR
ncbi:AIR synthase-related protein, partial [Frankia sp. EI5c]|uniref:AIR synthase-related protein n=1 Tax=Frankia sp. EI5c TaxID=683316 RepID=UPI001F5BE806